MIITKEKDKKMQDGIHYNCHGVDTVEPASQANQITANYYYCLVGQINRKTLKAAVCRVTLQNGDYSYHLISK